MNLLQLKEKTQHKKRVENLLKKAGIELTAEKEKLSRLTSQLKKEYIDVQRLKEGSLTTMFYELLGSKEKKLDKERQEYLAAKLKYDNCKKEIEELEYEIQKLKKELQEYGTPEIEYSRLLEEKKTGLKAIHDTQFLKYEEMLGTCFTQKKEVNEAIAIGERALQGLGYAISALKKAKGWGTVDMIGGGLLSTAVKRSNMNEAKELIQDVQVWLRRFKRELSDVRIQDFPNIDLQMDSFTSFADYFFDNLITDWVVQSKINRSLEGCEQVHAQISQILSQLKNSDKHLTEKYKTTKTEFTNYIENM